MNDIPENETPETAARRAAVDAEADMAKADALTEAETGGKLAAVEGAGPAFADDALVDLESELQDARDKLLRALADTENTRRIAAREKADASKYAIAGFAREMLQVGDNLGMAMMSVSPEARAADGNLDNLCVGIEMTLKALIDGFQAYGIRQVAAEGQPFNHDIHEAVQQVASPDVAEGTVIKMVRPGFTIHDRLLRPAQVVVATGGPKAEPAAAEAAAPTDGGEAATLAANPAGYAVPGAGPGHQVDEET